MLTSMMLAPAFHLRREPHRGRSRSRPRVTNFEQSLAEPVTLVRSPTLTNGMSFVEREGLEAGQAHQAGDPVL